MLWRVQNLIGRSHFDELAILHDRHPVGDVGDHAEIMGDEQNAGIVAGLQAP